MAELRPRTSLSKLALPIALGITAAILAIVAAQMDFKFIGALIIGILGLSCLMYLNDSHRAEFLIVAALAFVIPVNLDANFFFRPHLGGAPSISLNASFICLVALYLVRIYRYRTAGIKPLFVYERTMVWASLLFMFTGFLSLLNAPHWDLVLFEEIRLLTLLMTMLIVMNLRSDNLLNTFLFFLAMGALVQGLIATLQYISGSALGLEIFGGRDVVQLDIGKVVNRATGTIGHPNILGYYLEIILPLILALFLIQKTLWLRLFYFTAATFTILGIISTISRGAWITVPLSGVVVFLVLYRKKLFRLSTAIQLSVMAAGLIVALYFALPTIVMRMTADDHQSAATRMPLNYATVSIIKQYPVVGVGLNNFGEVFHDYDTTSYARVFTYRSVENNAVVERRHKHVVHNLILWVWAEVGTLGLLAFIWLFGAALMVAWRTWKKADEWSQAVMIGCITGFAAQFIHGMVDPGFRISLSVSMLVYSMFGLIGACSLKASSIGAWEVSSRKTDLE